ncbi:MAG: SBBP repeat-containing protein [Bacteroidia bacterium]|nr:SBBP repeat-containing protein [Bacteroidia bacterium]
MKLKTQFLVLALFFFSFIFNFTLSLAQNAQSKLSKLDRLFFIENKGQWHSDVLYLCRIGGLDVWITKYGVNYTFYKIDHNRNTNFSRTTLPKTQFEGEPQNMTILAHRVLFELQNYNHNPAHEGKKTLEGYYNYFIGNDETKHATYVGLYKEVWIKNVYKGIDIRYYFDNNRLRYDFIVQPYADASQIKFKLRGQDKVYTKGEKELCFTTRFGEVALTDLHTYQDSRTIPSKFVKSGEFWQIALGEYDKTKTIVIDPLVYSTYIGGSNWEQGYSIAVDGSGCAYITGYTNSTNYDITPGAFQTTFGGTFDVFVTKLNPSGNGLVYSTYIGGSSDDWGRSIAVDGSGNAYITGYTQSTNYDVTPGAFQTIHDGGLYDIFVTKLNSTGTGLSYSTYIGGREDDIAYSIAIDSGNNAYITGYTASNNYDVTPGAFQTTNEGIYDVFVTKINSSGTGLDYSTYLGGILFDYGYGIDVDNMGCAYITGCTKSSDYDVTVEAFQVVYGGGDYDVFVTKLNSTGSTLVYSTYIGGNNADYGMDIAVDDTNDCVYVAGITYSSDYDVTTSAFQTTIQGLSDAFVTKLNLSVNGLDYSTYIGGSNDDGASAVAIDASGHAYIVGTTQSFDYDITTGAFQTTHAANDDVFVTQLNPSGNSLVYSTYIGGNNNEQGRDIFVDGSSHAYITGYTESADYDVTAGAFQTTHAGGFCDVFATKLFITPASIQNYPNYQNSFTVYPTIAHNYILIENSTNLVQEYELIDISGKVLSVYALPHGKNTVELNLPQGLYFIRERKQGKTEKFAVE